MTSFKQQFSAISTGSGLINTHTGSMQTFHNSIYVYTLLYTDNVTLTTDCFILFSVDLASKKDKQQKCLFSQEWIIKTVKRDGRKGEAIK